MEVTYLFYVKITLSNCFAAADVVVFLFYEVLCLSHG